jgi:hypothetical protein
VAAGPPDLGTATTTVGCCFPPTALPERAGLVSGEPAAASVQYGAPAGATATAQRSGSRRVHAAIPGLLESERATVGCFAVPGTARAAVVRIAHRAEHVVAGRARAVVAARTRRRAVDYGPAGPAHVRRLRQVSIAARPATGFGCAAGPTSTQWALWVPCRSTATVRRVVRRATAAGRLIWRATAIRWLVRGSVRAAAALTSGGSADATAAQLRRHLRCAAKRTTGRADSLPV